MKNAALILKTIYDNLPMILTIIAIVAFCQSYQRQKRNGEAALEQSRSHGCGNRFRRNNRN